ncbi:MAG: LLM class flavin-dependent oxidoreductase [Acidimicrobiia bacterium]
MSILEKCAAVTVVRTIDEMGEIARTAERLGYWGVGVSDSPLLYHEMYPAITWLLGQTERIKVATNVTNPVSRHWTVHASSARTLDDIAPGRFLLGLAVGDGAVHSIGRKPATRKELAQVVRDMRPHTPDSVPIHLAVSGPKVAATAGEVADGIIVSTGNDPAAIKGLVDISRAHAPGPIEAWALLNFSVVEDESQVASARERAMPVSMAMSRFSLAETLDGKAVPEHLHDRIRTAFARYDHNHHAELGSANPNAHIFDEDPEAYDYLIDRFCIVDTPAGCVARLERILEEADLDGIWLVVGGDDPVGELTRLATGIA